MTFGLYMFFSVLFPPKYLAQLGTISALSQPVTHIRIGTRPSPLARRQANSVAAVLKHTNPSITTELVLLDSKSEHKTTNDAPTAQEKSLAMSSIDFTSVIDEAVARGDVDCGVHSLKDVPPDRRWHPSLRIACHMPRRCPLDVLIGAESLVSLPRNARIGSASIRRQAQLLSVRPDLRPVNLRGNVHTRLKALDTGLVDGLVLARAGLERLGMSVDKDIDKTSATLDSNEMLPAPAQGIVGVACRADNDEMLRLLAKIDDLDARIAATAERAFLNSVDGSAPWDGRPPLAAFMERDNVGSWILRVILARPDGRSVLRTKQRAPHDCSPDDASKMGTEAGRELLDLAGDMFFKG